MENIQKIIEKLGHSKLIDSIIVIIISFVIYRVISYLIMKSGKNEKTKIFTSKKSKTYLRMFRSILRYTFIIVTVLILLQVNGINVSSMLAGVGIISVIIGFAVQDVLKDIIKGFDIISDSYFHVGDVIKYEETEGKVLAIGLKTTKIEDVRTFNTISIANRNIEKVEVVSNSMDIEIPMPYELKVEEAERVINDILERIKTLDGVDECIYKNITELAESSVKYLINVRCKPELKRPVRRNVLRTIMIGLEDNNIQVPYNQIDVHNK